MTHISLFQQHAGIQHQFFRFVGSPSGDPSCQRSQFIQTLVQQRQLKLTFYFGAAIGSGFFTAAVGDFPFPMEVVSARQLIAFRILLHALEQFIMLFPLFAHIHSPPPCLAEETFVAGLHTAGKSCSGFPIISGPVKAPGTEAHQRAAP